MAQRPAPANRPKKTTPNRAAPADRPKKSYEAISKVGPNPKAVKEFLKQYKKKSKKRA